MSFFLFDRSHRGHLGKKVLQQSLQCLLVYTRAVFPEILLALLAPGTLSRLGLHGLSIFPIVGGFSGSLLLAIGRSPRAPLFEQPLLVLFSPPSLPRPHFFFVLHPLLSFSPIHLVSILEVPALCWSRTRSLLFSYHLCHLCRWHPFCIDKTNKQRHDVCLSSSPPPVFWGPRTQGPSRVRAPSLPKEAFRMAINARAALLISLSSRRRAKMVCLSAAYRTLARSLILARSDGGDRSRALARGMQRPSSSWPFVSHAIAAYAPVTSPCSSPSTPSPSPSAVAVSFPFKKHP